MIYVLILFLAVSFLAAGLALVYKPHLVLAANKWIREKVFGDHWVHTYRLRGATVAILLSIFFSLWSFHRGHYFDSGFTRLFISTDRLQYQCLQHIYAREYGAAKAIAERVLRREPANADALYQLSTAQVLSGEVAVGRENWIKAERIHPSSAHARRLRGMILQVENPFP